MAVGSIKIFESKDMDELETDVNEYIEDETETVDNVQYATAIDVVQTKVVKNYTAMVVVEESNGG